MGIHGEPGIRRGPLQKADEIVQQMADKILPDLPYQKGDEVSVLLNGLGATPKEELYIMARKLHEILKEKGIQVFNTYVGEFATSMEMAGASISLLKLDEELKSVCFPNPPTLLFYPVSNLKMYPMEHLTMEDIKSIISEIQNIIDQAERNPDKIRQCDG